MKNCYSCYVCKNCKHLIGGNCELGKKPRKPSANGRNTCLFSTAPPPNKVHKHIGGVNI